MWELFNEPFDIRPDGIVRAPGRPGLGFTLRADALERIRSDTLTAPSTSSSRAPYVDLDGRVVYAAVGNRDLIFGMERWLSY